MAKKTISDYDEEIAKLIQKKKQLEETLALNIGKYLIKSWNVSNIDYDSICKMIDAKKPESEKKEEPTDEKPNSVNDVIIQPAR